MKRSLRFALCIATGVFLTVVPAELLAHHSGDPKLDRAVEKANSDFIVAMKTGDAATIAAAYTEDASLLRSMAPAFRVGRKLRRCTTIDLHALVRHARQKLTRRNSSSKMISPMNQDTGKSGCSKMASCRSMAAVFSRSGSLRSTAIGRFF
jgi:hypothetical protein